MSLKVVILSKQLQNMKAVLCCEWNLGKLLQQKWHWLSTVTFDLCKETSNWIIKRKARGASQQETRLLAIPLSSHDYVHLRIEPIFNPLGANMQSDWLISWNVHLLSQLS